MKKAEFLTFVYIIILSNCLICFNEVTSLTQEYGRAPLIEDLHPRINSLNDSAVGCVQIVSLLRGNLGGNRNENVNQLGPKADDSNSMEDEKNESRNTQVLKKSQGIVDYLSVDDSNIQDDYDDSPEVKQKLDRRSPVVLYEQLIASPDSDNWSLKELIFGLTPSADIVNEANSVSAQLDSELKEELVTDSTKKISSSESVIDRLSKALGFSSTDRRKRSPQEVVVVTAEVPISEINEISESSKIPSDQRPWWEKMWYGNTPEVNDLRVANSVSSQIHEEINDGLQPDSSSMWNDEWFQKLLAMSYIAHVAYSPPSDLVTLKEDPDTSTSISPYSTPYTLLRYLVPESEYEKVAYDLYDMYSNPGNASYFKTLILFARIVAFFTPGLGIVEQIMFCVAMAKITWKMTIMYNNGRPMDEIAITILPELAYTLYMYRRDEETVSQYVLEPGAIVNISDMNAQKFINYTQAMDFPSLPPSKEQEIRADVTKLVDKYMTNLSPSKKAFAVDSLMRVSRFAVFINPKGDLKKTSTNERSNEEYTKIFMDVTSAKENMNESIVID